MSIPIPTVRPGDLIKADTLNALVQLLIDMDRRLATLEAITPGGGSKLVITGLSQTSLHVGDTLTVFGLNFGIAALNNISIDTTIVPLTAIDTTLSTDKQLVFKIPDVGSLPAQGANVTLRINNNLGADQRTFFLAPPVANLPNGNVVVTLTQWVDSTDPIGTDSLLVFNAKASVNVTETYTLTAATDVAGGTATMLGPGDVPITTVQLSPVASFNDPGTDLKMRLTLPAGTTGDHTVSLALTSQLNPAGLGGFSGQQKFTFGQKPPTVGTITFTPASVKPTTASFVQGQLQVPGGAGVLVTMNVVLPSTAPTGSYTITGPSFPTGVTGWTASLPSGATFNGSPTGQAPQITFLVTGATGAIDTTMTFGVSFGAGGAPFGDLPIRVHVL